MKAAMAILVCVLAAGLALAQTLGVIQETRAKMNGVRDNQSTASNAALGIGNKAPSAARPTPAPPKPSGGTAIPVHVYSRVAGTKGARKTPARRPVGAVLVQTSAPPAAAPKEVPPVTGPVAAGSAGAGENEPAPAAAEPENKWSGLRDPFVSPVVSHVGGSACNTGKKCLEIGAINLKGIVHAESGFIAVVSNSLNKAYFLHENDPVFNGYVVKITGDSIVFQETLQDRLGKSFTREVVKKITIPAV